MTDAERMNWRMPPLALLKPVEWSTGTKMGVLLLRGYLIVAVLLLIVKAIQVGGGFGTDAGLGAQSGICVAQPAFSRFVGPFGGGL